MLNKYLVAIQNRLAKKEEGATMVEYALLIALIAVVLITALNFLASKIGSGLSSVGTTIG